MAAFPFLRDNARWLAGGFLLTLFSSYGQTFYIALSSGHIRAELGLSHGEFGWLYLGATLSSAAMIPVAGRFADTVPVERYAAIVILGLAGSMVALANAHSLPVLFVSLAALRFFGQGLMGHAAMTAIGRWFVASRGRAVSTAAMGIQFGESVMPVSFVAIATLVGWRESWLTNAGFLFVIVLPAVYLLMRVPRTAQASEVSVKPQGRQWSRNETLRDPLFWLLSIGMLAPPIFGTIIFFHQVYLAELRGWALGQFAGSTPILSICAVCSTYVSGILTDRYNTALLLPAMLVLLAIGLLTLSFVGSAWAILVFMAMIGFAFGIYATAFGAIWPELYGTRHLGAIKSAVTSMMVISTALGPGLTGHLIDRGVPYPAQIAAMGIYCTFAAALMAVAVRISARRTRALEMATPSARPQS